MNKTLTLTGLLIIMMPIATAGIWEDFLGLFNIGDKEVSDHRNYTLDDNSLVIVHKDNMSIHLVREGKELFNITSSTPHYLVGDFTKTKEWGYTKTGEEIITSDRELVIRKNKVCALKDKLSDAIFSSWNADCIIYKEQYNISARKENRKVIVNWIGELDPTFENVNITDFVSYYNLTNFVNTDDWDDVGTNNKDIDDGGTTLVTDSGHCVGDLPCLNFTHGSSSGAVEDTLGNPISENWTIAIQVNVQAYQSSVFNYLYGGDTFSLQTGNPSSQFRCSHQQATGTQFPSVVINNSYALDTDYTLFCFKNGTTLCGQANNGSATCTALYGTQHDDQFQWLGRPGKNMSSAYLSSAAAWTRALNNSERQELYNCFSTRKDLREGCTEAGGADTTPPTCSSFSLNNTAPKNGEDVMVQCNATDETALDAYRGRHNQSGTMTNATAVDISGTNYGINYTASVTLSSGGVGCMGIWVNDTSNNVNDTGALCFTVAAADSCTYGGSGDWNIDAFDGCAIAMTNVKKNHVYCTGSGKITGLRNITNATHIHIDRGSGCEAKW